jgi:putative membrane protein
MRGLLFRWLILTAAVFIASWLLEGITVAGPGSAFLAAATLGILNAVLRPVLILLTLPINILTLGLFTFLINALMLKIVSGIIPGFAVRGFWTAILGALIIGVVSWLANAYIGGRGSVESASYIDLQKRGGRWE